MQCKIPKEFLKDVTCSHSPEKAPTEQLRERLIMICVCAGVGGGEMKHHFLLEWMGNWVFSDFVSSIALSCSLD